MTHFTPVLTTTDRASLGPATGFSITADGQAMRLARTTSGMMVSHHITKRSAGYTAIVTDGNVVMASRFATIGEALAHLEGKVAA
jgi:YD repeat-containing protein